MSQSWTTQISISQNHWGLTGMYNFPAIFVKETDRWQRPPGERREDTELSSLMTIVTYLLLGGADTLSVNLALRKVTLSDDTWLELQTTTFTQSMSNKTSPSHIYTTKQETCSNHPRESLLFSLFRILAKSFNFWMGHLPLLIMLNTFTK